MKKSMLYAGLLLTITQATYAEDAAQTTPPASAVSNTVTTPTAPLPEAKPDQPAPAAANTTSPSSAQNAPAASAPPAPATPVSEPTAPAAAPTNTSGSPVTQTTATPTTTPASAIDCHYALPATITLVEPSLVSQWAKKAVVQAFSFDFKTLDDQLAALKFCFTDQGWTGFSDALKKSGNLDAIKQEKLNVSSMLNGEATITSIKDNQWKVNLPLEVVYQNDKEKINQSLMIDLIVGRQLSGNLGIMQIIAVPKQTAETGAEILQPTTAAPTTPSATTPATNTTASEPGAPANPSATTPSSNTPALEPAAPTATSTEAPSSTPPPSEPAAPTRSSAETPSSSPSASEPVAPVATPETH